MSNAPTHESDVQTPATFSPEAVRSAVRDVYGAIAKKVPAGKTVVGTDGVSPVEAITSALSTSNMAAKDASCCAPTCCEPGDEQPGTATAPPVASAASTGCCPSPSGYTEQLGYSKDELASLPAGADIGLGCGNPQAIAALEPGQVVVDLGSGAGIDCFLAAKKVGAQGRVIGVDMTHAMLDRARSLAASEGVDNVEFRLGEIEHLPIEDVSVDVVISNCVVNLSPDPARVFAEAARVLRPGGRIAIYDVVALQPVPDALRQNIAAIAGCMGQASSVTDIQAYLTAAGLTDVKVEVSEASRKTIAQWMPGSGAEDYVASAAITARKPSLA